MQLNHILSKLQASDRTQVRHHANLNTSVESLILLQVYDYFISSSIWERLYLFRLVMCNIYLLELVIGNGKKQLLISYYPLPIKPIIL